jgi:hypothetical protein
MNDTPTPLQAPSLVPDESLLPARVDDDTPEEIVTTHTGKTITQPSYQDKSFDKTKTRVPVYPK